jgi:hypothetical protein
MKKPQAMSLARCVPGLKAPLDGAQRCIVRAFSHYGFKSDEFVPITHFPALHVHRAWRVRKIPTHKLAIFWR